MVSKGNANLKTGTPDVKPDAPSHTPGINEGNAPGAYLRQHGHLPDGRSTAERSTGVDVKAHEPIDPQMPNLSPA
jgi:hypothetical protein